MCPVPKKPPKPLAIVGDANWCMRKHTEHMKRFAPIAAVAVASLLLAGCQSKRNICAQYAAYASYQPDRQELDNFWERLEVGTMPNGIDDENLMVAINEFCEFYED